MLKTLHLFFPFQSVHSGRNMLAQLECSLICSYCTFKLETSTCFMVWKSESLTGVVALLGSSTVYPLVVAAHPLEPNQFALGLSDGGVQVIEPLESEGKWGVGPPPDNGVPSGPASGNQGSDQTPRWGLEVGAGLGIGVKCATNHSLRLPPFLAYMHAEALHIPGSEVLLQNFHTAGDRSGGIVVHFFGAHRVDLEWSWWRTGVSVMKWCSTSWRGVMEVSVQNLFI